MRLKVWMMVLVGITGVVNACGQREDGMKESIRLKKIKTFKRARSGHFSTDGTKLALKGNEKVRIVEIKTGKVLCELKLPDERTDNFSYLAFTRDWEKFAISFTTGEAGSYKKKVILVEASTCKEIKTLYHKKWVSRSLYFFRDGKKLAYHSIGSGFLRFIDAESGKDEIAYEMAYDMNSFPEGYAPRKNVLSSDEKWFVIYAERLPSVSPHLRSVSPSFSGSPRDFPSLYVVDLESGEGKLLSKSDEINEFKFSRDSKLLVANSFIKKNYDKEDIRHERTESNYEMTKSKVYEVGSWKLLWTFEKVGEFFDISPDNKLLATGRSWGDEKRTTPKKGIVRIYSLETGEKLEEQVHYKRTLWDDLVELVDNPVGATQMNNNASRWTFWS